MSVTKNVPDIRFNDFSDDWSEKKIGMILSETKRPIELMDNDSYPLVTVKRRNEGVVPRAILKGKNILVKNYFTIKAGDYLISKRQVVHGANGIVPRSLDNAVVSNEYLVVTDSDEMTAQFWATISKRPEMYKLFFVSSYGVDIEKLVFDVADWKKRKVRVPQITEQKRITDYFQKLDTLINQHQQKHDKLSNLKKAMLEKMFPKAGETVPEIRFEGFSGDWKEKCLGEAAPLRGGFAFPSFKFGSSGVPIVKISNILFTGEVGGEFNYFKETTNDENYLLLDGSALLAMSGATTGKVSILKCSKNSKFYQNQRVGYFQKNTSFDYLFISTLVRSHVFKEKLDAVLVAGAQPNISSKEIDSFEFLMPSDIDEQTQIGNYFRSLDVLINQHNQQITKLKNIKQACLDKMFV